MRAETKNIVKPVSLIPVNIRSKYQSTSYNISAEKLRCLRLELMPGSSGTHFGPKLPLPEHRAPRMHDRKARSPVGVVLRRQRRAALLIYAVTVTLGRRSGNYIALRRLHHPVNNDFCFIAGRNGNEYSFPRNNLCLRSLECNGNRPA